MSQGKKKDIHINVEGKKGRKGKQPQEIDNQVLSWNSKWVLNVLLWLDLMNVVKTGFFWPRGRGALLDMIFRVAVSCTGCALTTMARLRETVNMCLGP